MHDFLHLNAAFMPRPVFRRKTRLETTHHLVSFRIPKSLVQVIDATAADKDTDRSKWIREAIREKAGIRAGG